MTVLCTTRSQFSLEVPASAAAVKGLRKFQGFELSSFAASVLCVVAAPGVVAILGVVAAVSCVGLVRLVAVAGVLHFSIPLDSMRGTKLSPVYAKGP